MFSPTGTPSHAPSSAQASAGRRVIDAPVRMFHWLLALSFTGAYLTAESERLRLVHVALGYTMAGLLLFRLAYGLLGPRQARWSMLAAKLRGALPWLHSLRNTVTGAPGAPAVNWRQGQNLLMAALVAGMLLLVAPVVFSGWAGFNDWGGEWLGELHEGLGNGLLALVLGHLAWLLLSSLVRRRNLATPMLSGRTEGAGPDLARHNHGWLGALLLVGVLGFWGWAWWSTPAAGQGVPAWTLSLPGTTGASGRHGDRD
jgi:cytochrome b